MAGIMRYVVISLFLLITVEVALGQASQRPAAIYAREGWLTEIEEDGFLVIDREAFALDSRAQVLDQRGVRTSVAAWGLPAFVRYEFVYLPTGPTIVSIRQNPEIPR